MSQKLTDFENACRKANLKVTHQRLEIFRELTEAHDHPSAETLFKRLQKKLPTLSLDTIYRTLATFEKHGLISRVETVKSQARFEAEMAEPFSYLQPCFGHRDVVEYLLARFTGAFRSLGSLLSS